MGLAQQAQQGPAQPQGMDQQKMMELVKQVAKLLQQGASPEELMQQGVPEQVIDMALKMVGQPDQDQDQDVPQGMQGEQGLAASSMMG